MKLNIILIFIIFVFYNNEVYGSSTTSRVRNTLSPSNNIPLFETAPKIKDVGIDGVKKWIRHRTKKFETYFNGRNVKRVESPKEWSKQIIYSIMPDRFANGNISNDKLNIQSAQEKNDLSQIGSFKHGGDIEGIINRLDYLKDMGITTLWLLPIFMNDGSYHGYCVTDPTNIDPNFGTWHDYQRLIDECHKRDIYVVQDIVINHICSRKAYYSKKPQHQKCAAKLDEQFWKGEIVGDESLQGEIHFDDNFFGPLASKYFYNRCGANSGSETGSESAAAVYGDFVSTMFDFATYNYDFQEIFRELYKPLITIGVDGFRLDAAKHVSEDFVADFSTHMRDYADKIGKNNFFVVGEVAASQDWIGRRLGKMYHNPKNPTQHGNVPKSLTKKIEQLEPLYSKHKSDYPGLDAVYNFAESGTSRGAMLLERGSDEVAKYYDSSTYKTIAAQADYDLSWTLLDIHDWPRYLKNHKNDADKAISGASYLLLAPGQPIIWMGYEQGFNQNCHFDSMKLDTKAKKNVQHLCEEAHDDVLMRQDMFQGPWRLGSAIKEIDDMNYIGPVKPAPSPKDWTKDKYLRTDHSLYKTIKKLTHIRSSCGAINSGKLVWRDAEPRIGGLLVFSRIKDQDEILIIINPNNNERDITKYPIDNNINFNSKGRTYVNLLNKSQTGKVGYENNGAMLYFNNVKVNAHSYLVFVKESNTVHGTHTETLVCKK